MRKRKKIFDRGASIAALKREEEDRGILRGWRIAKVASVDVLWNDFAFNAEDIVQTLDDVELLKQSIFEEARNNTWKESAFQRINAIKEELGIDTLYWPAEKGLNNSEVLGAALGLEMVICALHDDDYFVVTNDEIIEFHDKLRDKMYEYSNGDLNLSREARVLGAEIGVCLD